MALRKYAPDVQLTPAPTPVQEQAAAPAKASKPEPPIDLSAVNPDYIAWIRIDGTAVDYPAVRGEDNEKYLTVTFSGEQNASGAIFMDSRCAEGFDSAFAILYGHNMRDGSMFSDLNRYLEDGYLADYPDITILTPEGETLVYRVFAVIKTDVWDEAYTLPDGGSNTVAGFMAALSAPVGAQRFIALSTCTDGGHDTERLLVFGAR
jgi:sortase B